MPLPPLAETTLDRETRASILFNTSPQRFHTQAPIMPIRKIVHIFKALQKYAVGMDILELMDDLNDTYISDGMKSK